MITIAELTLNQDKLVIGSKITKFKNSQGLQDLYKNLIGNYPKFHKMDGLSKVGFIASELLLKDFPEREKENCGITLFNRSGSLVTDRNYQKTISDKDNYFPSPSIFVYTLANIVTGEIAIRHKIYGETSFYIMEEEDSQSICDINEAHFATSNVNNILTGWLEYEDDFKYYAHLKLVTR